MNTLNSKINYGIPVVSLLSSFILLFIMLWNENGFLWLTMEDGLLEWLTVVFMVIAALLVFRVVLTSWRNDQRFDWFYILFALGCILVAGEEISWGQRFFNIDTPSFFTEINDQNETTLHNINVGGIDVGYLVGKAERILLTVYFLILPILCYLSSSARYRLQNAGFFVPPIQMVLTYFAAILLPLGIKIWSYVGEPTEIARAYNPEVLEFFIGVICLHVALIYMNRVSLGKAQIRSEII